MKKTKWYVALMLLVSVSLIVSACAPTPPTATPVPTKKPAPPTATPEPPEEEVVLHIMGGWGPTDSKYAPLQSIYEDFMKAYPYITLEEEVFSEMDIPAKVNTAFLAKAEPDIVFSNLFMETLDWAEDGVTIDLSDLIKEWGLQDKFKSGGIAQYTDSKGRLRAFPLEGYIWPVWYNMQILKEAGVEEVPQTTDELIAAAKKIRAAGYQPFATGGADWTGWIDVELAFSTMLTKEEIEQLSLNGGFADNPHAVAGMELFTKLRDEGVFVDDVEGLDFGSRNEMFYAGKAAIMHGGSWCFANCPDEIKSNVVLDGFPLPSGSPHKTPLLYEGFDAKGVWITRNGAEKMDAIEKFVKFFFQPERIALFVEQAAINSPLKDTPVDESKLDPLLMQSMGLSDLTVVQILENSVAPHLYDSITKAFLDAYLPGTSAESVIANLDEIYKESQ